MWLKLLLTSNLLEPHNSVCCNKVAMFFTGTNITVATTYYNAHFGESRGPYHLDNLYCNGYKTNLLSCSRQYTTGGIYNNGVGVHNCAPGNEAGVKCDGV